jgi:hypothetical protein
MPDFAYHDWLLEEGWNPQDVLSEEEMQFTAYGDASGTSNRKEDYSNYVQIETNTGNGYYEDYSGPWDIYEPSFWVDKDDSWYTADYLLMYV